MRDDVWLKKQLDHLLSTYFSNVTISNPIDIRFGREAKYRFGSIRLIKPKGLKRILGSTHPAKSLIIITSMFAEEEVPVGVVQYTIAHELCHYAHGFSSTNKRLFKYPHHGGVVNHEIKERGGEKLILAYKNWLKQYREQILSGRTSI